MYRTCVLLSFTSGCLITGLLQAEELKPLPLGKTQQDKAEVETPLIYEVKITEPGVLMVAARSKDDQDIGIDITDGDGQILPDGYGDWDLFGKLGAEQQVATLGSAGTYRVYISAFEDDADIVLGAQFLPMPEARTPDDPHSRPGTAIKLNANAGQVSGSIRPMRGEHRDWYVVTPTDNGVLTVYTRSSDDLILEAYTQGHYFEATAFSDNDDQSVMGNVSMTLDVRRDEPMYFRVSTYENSADYLITVGQITTNSAPTD